LSYFYSSDQLRSLLEVPPCTPSAFKYPQLYINGAGNIIANIAVLVMPFLLLKRLDLPKQRKLLLFGTSGLVLYRGYSVLRIESLRLFEGFTWENVESLAWSIGELCLEIMCACVPILRPFWKAHFPAWDAIDRKVSGLWK
jgi:hypothetical protein